MASILDSIFGSKPQVAPYIPTSLTDEQLNAIDANIAAMPDITQLGDLYQTYMMDAFNQAIPGFSNILSSGGQMTQEMIDQATSYLHGEIPPDVAAALQRQDAYTSLMSGTAGSPMSGALTARDLGLTSMNLIQQGAQLAGQAGNAAQRWAGLASGMIMSPSGMMITPQQLAEFKMQNRLLQQATKQFGYNVAAAPSPAGQALNQWIEQVGGTILSSYATGGMSKGGNFETSYNPNQYGSSTNFGSNVSQGIGGSYSPGGFNFGGVPTAGAATPGVYSAQPEISFNTPMSPGYDPYMQYYGASYPGGI